MLPCTVSNVEICRNVNTAHSEKKPTIGNCDVSRVVRSVGSIQWWLLIVLRWSPGLAHSDLHDQLDSNVFVQSDSSYVTQYKWMLIIWFFISQWLFVRPQFEIAVNRTVRQFSTLMQCICLRTPTRIKRVLEHLAWINVLVSYWDPAKCPWGIVLCHYGRHSSNRSCHNLSINHSMLLRDVHIKIQSIGRSLQCTVYTTKLFIKQSVCLLT